MQMARRISMLQLTRPAANVPAKKCQQRCLHRVVHPGNISPTLQVPTNIKCPPYTLNASLLPPNQAERKSPGQIEKVKDSCSVARYVLNAVSQKIEPGITTDALDKYAHYTIINCDAYPSPLHYMGYPKSICTSVNNVVCHGIPDDAVLTKGDIINIDITVYYNGYHGDVSETYVVGDHSDDNKLVQITRECLYAAISQCAPQQPYTCIGAAIEELCHRHGFSVVPEYCGHGIGSYFHGPPDIYHFKNDLNCDVMEEGVTFTIEPILCEGDPAFHIHPDGWTATTVDGSRTAQFEHTVCITKSGVKILTD